jgi:hypothetical protein
VCFDRAPTWRGDSSQVGKVPPFRCLLIGLCVWAAYAIDPTYRGIARQICWPVIRTAPSACVDGLYFQEDRLARSKSLQEDIMRGMSRNSPHGPYGNHQDLGNGPKAILVAIVEERCS